MSFAMRKRRITGRQANRLQTSRGPSDGGHRTGSARAVEVAGPQPFAVEVQRRDAGAIVQPRGELDVVTVETLRAALDGIGSTERLVLDLRGLSFIDSTGLQLLVALHQRAQRDRVHLTLVAPAAPVDRAIQLCGLDKQLPFVAVADAEPGESASGPQGEARSIAPVWAVARLEHETPAAAERGVSVPRSGTGNGRGRVGDGRAEQDRALFARYLDRRDPVDREMLVERFLPLARQLARRYQRPDEPFDDLFQVACLGLINAIDRFSLERGVAFSSFAVPTILGEIKRYFRDRTWSVRVPRDLQDLALKVDRAVSELSLDLHRQPTVAEIGEKVGADEEDVLEALQASHAYRATSLQTPWGADDDSGDTLGDAIGHEECGFAAAEDRATIEHVMRVITPREREVLRLRFVEDLTQAEIGERIGISQMQVSRVIRQALGRLRSYATAHEDAHARPSRSAGVSSRRASQRAFAR
jgi:RNA polymerase sigma-B factor